MSGVSPAGRFAYVRTAAMDASPGTVLGARAAQWIAPAATFVLASAPFMAEAAGPRYVPMIPQNPIALYIGIGGALTGAGCVLVAEKRDILGGFYFGFFAMALGIFGSLASLTGIELFFSPKTLSVMSCASAVVSWVFNGISIRQNRQRQY